MIWVRIYLCLRICYGVWLVRRTVSQMDKHMEVYGLHGSSLRACPNNSDVHLNMLVLIWECAQRMRAGIKQSPYTYMQVYIVLSTRNLTSSLSCTCSSQFPPKSTIWHYISLMYICVMFACSTYMYIYMPVMEPSYTCTCTSRTTGCWYKL